MKINDVIIESQINEFGLTKKSRAVRRGRKEGKEKLKQVTVALYQDLAQFLGVKGKKISKADTADIIEFLNTKGLDSSDIDTDLPMNKSRIDKILKVKAKDKLFKKSPKTPEFKSQRSGNDDQDLQKMIDALKAAGYSVTK